MVKLTDIASKKVDKKAEKMDNFIYLVPVL